MHSAIKSMIDKYNCKTEDDYRNALNEIVQEIALLGLYRGGFFNKAAFYGGTALRIFFDLDRFSEDLDFSLLEPDLTFELSGYTKVLQDELGAYGLEMTVEEKIKSNNTPVKSAFIKGGTQIHLLKISPYTPPISGIHPDEQIKVEIEVDTDPPAGADYEVKYQLQPVPYNVRLYTPSSLFAGKLHAILCRKWRNRVKGRDYYDYVWYLSRGIKLNFKHLKNRMVQSGHLAENEDFSEEILHKKLKERFESIDFNQVKIDVSPFIKNQDDLSLWSSEFFAGITEDKLKLA